MFTHTYTHTHTHTLKMENKTHVLMQLNTGLYFLLFGQGVLFCPVFLTTADMMEMAVFCNLEKYTFIEETEEVHLKWSYKLQPLHVCADRWTLPTILYFLLLDLWLLSLYNLPLSLWWPVFPPISRVADLQKYVQCNFFDVVGKM